MSPIHARSVHNLVKTAAVLLLLLLELSVYGQIKSIGTPNITHYSREDYNASTQNWDILQDKQHQLLRLHVPVQQSPKSVYYP